MSPFSWNPGRAGIKCGQSWSRNSCRRLQRRGPLSAKKHRIGIVGLAFGAEFIPIYQKHPSAEMYAICQRTRAKLDQVGDTFGIGRRYEDYAAMLKDPDLDAVHINSPIPDHAPMTLAALKAGKHVM